MRVRNIDPYGEVGEGGNGAKGEGLGHVKKKNN